MKRLPMFVRIAIAAPTMLMGYAFIYFGLNGRPFLGRAHQVAFSPRTEVILGLLAVLAGFAIILAGRKATEKAQTLE